MSWDKGLTEEQKHAASITGRHVRLLAGPGTGKTTCITSRVVYLISEKNVKPENIIVLTFTRAAASELRERIANELETLPATIKV
ncbi:MAG TPA: UvrD-helicase domain-containing protein [Bellilinea sp.]|nr:UvrD-helicase domain-containing protein [Bellilinea sp.]